MMGMEVVVKDAKEKNKILRENLAAYSDNPAKLMKQIVKLRKQMKKASDNLEFEEAARIRTFVYSRRYQDMALIVGEENVTLLGFIESPD